MTVTIHGNDVTCATLTAGKLLRNKVSSTTNELDHRCDSTCRLFVKKWNNYDYEDDNPGI